MDKFTEKEKEFLMQLLAQVKLSPLAPEAIESVKLVQSVAQKIEANTEKVGDISQ